MQTVAVIDYGMGNLHSVAKALEHVKRQMAYRKDKVTQAAKLLDLYLRDHPDSDLGWKTLVSAYQQAGDETNLHLAFAEGRALQGDFLRAMDELNVARATTSDKLVTARIDARLVQLEQAKRQDESLKQ